MQAWASGAKRAFLEVFAGCGGLTVALRCEGVSVGEPIDRDYSAYGTTWNLSKLASQSRFTYLIRRVVDPLGLHFALPAGNWGNASANDQCRWHFGEDTPGDKDWSLARLTVECLVWQQTRGALGSFEGPANHALRETTYWKAHFGHGFTTSSVALLPSGRLLCRRQVAIGRASNEALHAYGQLQPGGIGWTFVPRRVADIAAAAGGRLDRSGSPLGSSAEGS